MNKKKEINMNEVADKEMDKFDEWCKESDEMEKHIEKEREQAEKDFALLNTGVFDGTVINYDYDLGEFVPKYQQTYLSVCDKEGKQTYIGVSELLKMLSFCAGRDFIELPFWWGYNVCKRYDISPFDFFSNVLSEDEIAVYINRERYKYLLAGDKKIGTHGCRNNNMHNPLVNDVFFEALEAYPNDLKGTRVHIADGYVSFWNENDDLKYDNTPKKVVPDKEWSKNAYKWNCEEQDRINNILKNKGLLEAWNALKKWLRENDSVPTIESDGMNSGLNREAQAIINRSLLYGYKVSGVDVFSDKEIVWKLYVFDRTVTSDDVIRGRDEVYLMYDGKDIYPVVRSTTMKLYKKEHIEENEPDCYVRLDTKE